MVRSAAFQAAEGVRVGVARKHEKAGSAVQIIRRRGGRPQGGRKALVGRIIAPELPKLAHRVSSSSAAQQAARFTMLASGAQMADEPWQQSSIKKVRSAAMRS